MEGKEIERLHKEVQHLKEELASEKMKGAKQPSSIEDIKDDSQKIVMFDFSKTI